MSVNISTADAAPATLSFAITPSDTAAFPQVLKSIYVGSGGSVALRTLHGGTVVYRNLPDAG